MSHAERATLRAASGCGLILAALAVSGGWPDRAVAQAAAPARVEIDTVQGPPSARLWVGATLRTEVEVVGLTGALAFGTNTRVVARPDGRPDCMPTPALPFGAFAFLPRGCDPARDCTAVQLLFVSLGPVMPIADGTVLFTCDIDIAATAAAGTFPLVLGELEASDGDGDPVAIEASNGAVVVTDTAPVRLGVASIHGSPRDPATLDVVLHAGVDIALVESELRVPPQLSLAVRADGRPNCAIGDEVPPPSAASFAFLPEGCTPGDDCSGIHALVLSLSPSPLRDDTILFACPAVVAANATPGTFPIDVVDVVAQDGDGGDVPAGGIAGALVVDGGTPTPTETSPPSASTSASPTPTPSGRHASGSRDGCQVGAPVEEPCWQWLLVAAAAAAVRGRRRCNGSRRARGPSG